MSLIEAFPAVLLPVVPLKDLPEGFVVLFPVSSLILLHHSGALLVPVSDS
jgi:hypothetical protein